MKVMRELLESALATDIYIDETKVTPTSDDDSHVRIQGHLGDEEENDVEWAAIPIIYAISALSFHDARPRGLSEADFVADDEWLPEEILRHIRFERGELHFYADYVRGRMMKTTIDIRRDGTFVLDTVNRGEVATRWIAKLQGKKILEAVMSAGSNDDG